MNKIKISTSGSVIINTGNYETITVHKEIEREVEYEKPEDIVSVSEKTDGMLVFLLKKQAEETLKLMGRKRHSADTKAEIELWAAYKQS